MTGAHRRRRALRLRWMLVLLPLLAAPAAPPTQAAEQVVVFAAASVTDALNAAIAAYGARAATRVVPVYAASSVLARQIAAGAPAALFLSASPEWVSWLEERGALIPGSRVDLLGNRLVLAAYADTPLLPSLTAALSDDGPLADGRLAIADPDHVPAGRYAQQALQALGVWALASRRAVRAGNVRSALALIERGETPLGIVYRTDLAICRSCRIVAEFPPAAHAPIVYPLAMIADHRTAAAEAFHEFLRGSDAAALFSGFGFTVNMIDDGP